jgi:hypothetical protein
VRHRQHALARRQATPVAPPDHELVPRELAPAVPAADVHRAITSSFRALRSSVSCRSWISRTRPPSGRTFRMWSKRGLTGYSVTPAVRVVNSGRLGSRKRIQIRSVTS